MSLPTRRFPRRARLLTGSDYRRVFAEPRRSSDSCFTVLARENGMALPRLGLAISKKRLRRAVDRNRLKRIVRESFRLDGNALGAVDVVVLAGPAVQRHSPTELREYLRHHWDKINRRCRPS